MEPVSLTLAVKIVWSLHILRLRAKHVLTTAVGRKSLQQLGCALLTITQIQNFPNTLATPASASTPIFPTIPLISQK